MLQELCLSQGDQLCLHWFFLLQEQTIKLLLDTLIEWYNYQNQPTKHKYHSRESALIVIYYWLAILKPFKSQ